MSSFILCNNNKLFLCWIVKCDKKWILYNNYWWLAQWLDWEEAPEHFPKPNLHQKKKNTVMATVLWPAARLIHCSFLNPGKTITSEKYAQPFDGMHQKLQCLRQHWSTERAQFLTWRCPEVAPTGLPSFASSAVFTWPLLNQWLLLQASRQLFAGKMLLQPAGGRECFPRGFWIC